MTLPDPITERLDWIETDTNMDDPNHEGMLAALRGVLAIHVPYPTPQKMIWGTIIACNECGSVDERPTELPCPTLLAIATALDVTL